MKKIVKLIGIIALTAIIGFSMTACVTGTTASVSENTVLIEETTAQVEPGTLTITGLDSYNGYFICANGYLDIEDASIIAANDIVGIMYNEFMIGSEIVNGSATLPVWRITGYDYDNEDNAIVHKERYTRSDTIDLFIIIFGGESDHFSTTSMSSVYNVVAEDVMSITFEDGIASVVSDIPDFSEYNRFEMY